MPLPPERVAAVDAAVDDLHERLREHGDFSVPLDIAAAARISGLRILQAANGITGALIENRSGVAVSGLLDFSTGRIYVDAREGPMRQRFTIAHEIAHEVLGHERLLGGHLHVVPSQQQVQASGHEFDAGAGDPGVDLEREADRFAGRLLVPPPELELAIVDLGCASVPLLASTFQVSAHAMQVRLSSHLPAVRRA